MVGINLWEGKMDKRFFILVIGVFIMSSVLALGITPGRTTIDFESGAKKDVSFDVINSGGTDIKVVFSAQGDLAEYISLPVRESVILGSEKTKSFSYSLNLPSTLEPGLNTGEIIVSQLPTEGSSAGSQIIATLAVVTQVHLYVPYPGKYANAKMYVYGANVGEAVRIVIPVVSVGEFDLTSVSANVDIYSGAGERIDSFNIGPISVPSGTKKELVYDWVKNVPIGNYVAKASLIYDDGIINLEESFSVGSEELELQEINVKDFNLGEIAKLEMLVENKWSSEISEVYIETKILNDKGGVVSDFKSSSNDIDALSKQVFVSYWDTNGVLEGDYDAEVSIKYADKISEKGLKFKVSQNELVIVGLGYVISAEDSSGEIDTIVIVLVVIIVLMVLINLLWFFLLRKKLMGGRK